MLRRNIFVCLWQLVLFKGEKAVKLKYDIGTIVFATFTLIASFKANADTYPVFALNDAEIRSAIYYGMGYDDFRSRLGSKVTGCYRSSDISIADIKCKAIHDLRSVGMSEINYFFKQNVLISVVAKINGEYHDSLKAALQSAFNAQPKVVRENEGGGEQYSQHLIWTKPDYLMVVSGDHLMVGSALNSSKTIKNANFYFVTESANRKFIGRFQSEFKKRSNVDLIAGFDRDVLANQHDSY